MYSNFIMFTLLFNFKLLSVFRCYRHYSTLLCIFVTIIHGSIGDTADSSTVRHGRIESTSIITNSSSLSQPPSSASSVSIKSHADDFSTSRKFNGLLNWYVPFALINEQFMRSETRNAYEEFEAIMEIKHFFSEFWLCDRWNYWNYNHFSRSK